MPRVEAETELFEQIDDATQTSSDVFDRIAFAEQALALVRPRRTTVAICEGVRRVRVEAGRQWGREPDAKWAMLFVPRDASRRAIANAVLHLAGTDARPWSLDVLIHSCKDPYR